jgi:hypothetical protein
MELEHSACYRALAPKTHALAVVFLRLSKQLAFLAARLSAKTPRSENGVFYASTAATQEAGFRPCLRCRPETAPGLGAWCGSSNTESKALSLIEEGAVDESDVDSLAARLGGGERQLPEPDAFPTADASLLRAMVLSRVAAERPRNSSSGPKGGALGGPMRLSICGPRLRMPRRIEI